MNIDYRPTGGRSGLTTSTLQTDMEIWLRQSGLSIKEDFFVPFLRAEIAVGYLPAGLWVYHVQLQVEQGVALLRDASVHLPASTWTSTVRFGVATDEHMLQDRVRGGLRDQVHEFINDYLKRTQLNDLSKFPSVQRIWIVLLLMSTQIREPHPLVQFMILTIVAVSWPGTRREWNRKGRW